MLFCACFFVLKCHEPQAEDTFPIYADTIWKQEFRAENPKAFNDILDEFEARGALAPVSLTAIDENGSPIPGASVRMSFSSPDGIDNPVIRSGTTDATGRFAAEARSIWSVGWIVEKEGFYSFRSNMVLREFEMTRRSLIPTLVAVLVFSAYWSLRCGSNEKGTRMVSVPKTVSSASVDERSSSGIASSLQVNAPIRKGNAISSDSSAETRPMEWIRAATDPENESLYIGQMNFSRLQEAVGPPLRDEASVYAYNHGARSKVTIRIVDENGTPVPDAQVSAVHCRNWTFVNTDKFVTRNDGIIVLENRNADQYRIGVLKTGYYGLFVEIHFFSQYSRCVENGRWIPWNPHVDLVLKSKDNPIKLEPYDVFIHSEDLSVPLDSDIPFDLLEGDFLPPFGNGKTTNAFVRVTGTTRKEEVHAITAFRFLSGGGVSKLPKDGFCHYMYPKRIGRENFESEFLHEWHWTDLGGSIQKVDTDPTGRECIALRVPDIDSDGERSFRYGFLYSPPRAHVREDGSGFCSFSVQYFLNPIPGDRNVEAPDQLKK